MITSLTGTEVPIVVFSAVLCDLHDWLLGALQDGGSDRATAADWASIAPATGMEQLPLGRSPRRGGGVCLSTERFLHQ